MAIRLFSMREIIKRGEARGKPAGRPEHDSHKRVTGVEKKPAEDLHSRRRYETKFSIRQVWKHWLPVVLWGPVRSRIRPGHLPATFGNHRRQLQSSERKHRVRRPGQ